MGIFKKSPEQLLMKEALKLAKDIAQPKIVTQGGGGGSETR